MTVFTIGPGTRPADELVGCLREAGVQTLVDVRRYPGSRRNPQFGQPHELFEESEIREGKLYLCGALVA